MCSLAAEPALAVAVKAEPPVSQREDDDSLKRFLREGLKNTSVTCVLVGERTTFSRWVRYEIFRSFMCGNGLLAVRINSISDFRNPPTLPGPNPFDDLAFDVDQDRVRFREYLTTGWGRAIDVGSMPQNEVRYDLGNTANHTLACLFPIYDWEVENGRQNLNRWIEKAAQQAGR
jgi:hypothetical protein